MSNCVSPFIVHSQYGDFPTRCGHCINCKIQYANEWATRLLHHSMSFPFSSFVTLTYSDEYNPYELSVEVLQKWQKRLRQEYKRFGHDDKLQFFSAGEYGEESALIDGVGRPHYHSIVFGLNPFSNESYDLIKKTWKYQDYDVLQRKKVIGNLTYASARYVSQYILKKYYDDDYINKVYGDRQQPFRIMSKGIGKKYIERYQDEIIENNGLIYSGNGKALISPPAYYRKFVDSQLDWKEQCQAILISNTYQENINIQKKNQDRKRFFTNRSLK